MVCCTGSWPPIQPIKRDAFPSILGFSCCLFPWYGLRCFLINMLSPSTHPHEGRLFLSSGRDRENLRQKWQGAEGGVMGKSSLSHPLPWTFSNLTVATGFQEAENTEREEGGKTKKPRGDSWSLAPILHPPPLLARAAWKLGEPTDPGVLKPRLMGRRWGLRNAWTE